MLKFAKVVVCVVTLIMVFTVITGLFVGHAEEKNYTYGQYSTVFDKITGHRCIKVNCVYDTRDDAKTREYIGADWMWEIPLTTHIETYMIGDNPESLYKFVSYQTTVLTNDGPVLVHYEWIEFVSVR